MSQSLPIPEQLKILAQIQEIDLKIANLNKQKNALPAELKTLESSLQLLEKKFTDKSAELETIEKTQRQVLAALELNKDRSDRTNKKLEGVGNNKEYQAAVKEVDQLTKLNTQLESQKKELEEKSQSATAEVESLKKNITELRSKRDVQAADVKVKVSGLDEELGRLGQERGTFEPSVDARTLNAYNRIRTARAGIGIVPAVGGRCKGCNMMVPPQLYNEIRKHKEVHSCPSCNRLIFVPEVPASGAPGAPSQS